MASILAIGDPHFKSDNGESTYELTAKVCELIRSRLGSPGSLTAVVVLGDILHRHEKIDLHPFHRAMTFLQSIHDCIRETDAFLYVIIGNHDRSNNQVFMTDEHVFNPLKLWKNTIVVDRATIHSPKEGVKFLLVPYVPPGRFREAYETVISEVELNTGVQAVFAHQEFKGARMGAVASEEGDPWDTSKPLCVSGHIHDYQEVSANMIYVGTPIQHGFADVGKKTVSVFDLSQTGYTQERIDLGIKGKITHRCNVEDFKLDDLDLEKYYVKVKATGTKRAIKTFRESKAFSEAERLGVVFQFLELPTVEIEERLSKVDSDVYQQIHSGKSFQERLQESLEKMDPMIRDEYRELFKTF